jgi:hypothetical protein
MLGQICFHVFWKGYVKFIKYFKGGAAYKSLGTSGRTYFFYETRPRDLQHMLNSKREELTVCPAH